MPARGGLKVHGYREFQRALVLLEPAARRELRSAFRDVGEGVRTNARDRFEDTSEKSARGYRTVVRTRGVEVEQSLRKTTGTRPDWGTIQMREALLPALDEEHPEIEERMQKAMDQVADYFELVARWQSFGLLSPP